MSRLHWWVVSSHDPVHLGPQRAAVLVDFLKIVAKLHNFVDKLYIFVIQNVSSNNASLEKKLCKLHIFHCNYGISSRDLVSVFMTGCNYLSCMRKGNHSSLGVRCFLDNDFIGEQRYPSCR